MKRNNYKFDTTFDAEKQLKKEFKNFSEENVLIYESQSKRVVGESYFETACWANIKSNEFFFYEFESFVTPSKNLSSSDYHVIKESFSDLQALYSWAKQDKRYLEVFSLADIHSIEKSKIKIESQLPEKSTKNKIKTKI